MFVMTPPAVSIPLERATTSSKMTESSLADLSAPPVKIAAWTAAPYATASSGLIDLLSSFPLKKSCKSCYTFGILVDPPTRTISFISDLENPESQRTLSTGPKHFLNKSIQSSSNLALEI